MSPHAELSRALYASALVFFLLLTIVRDTGGQSQDAGTERYLPRDDLDTVNQLPSLPLIRSRIPNTLQVNEEEEEVAGQALEQYKTLHFTCEDRGVFPKTGSCKQYYYCETSKEPEPKLSAFELTCPNTSVFDTETKACIPSSISTRPECKRAEHLNTDSQATDVIAGGDNLNSTRKRSDETTSLNITSCTEKIAEHLAEISREACTSTRDIDTYISNVKAVRPLELRSFNQEEYEAIIRGYDRDLKLTQGNYDEWRHGNSVLSAINETFLAAKNFELTLNTKFEENQVRVKEITSADTPDIKQMEDDISALKTEINQTQESISILEGLPLDLVALDYLKKKLRENEQELDQLVSDDLRVKTEKEVAALMDFLEQVRLQVVGIQENAIDSATRIETFHQKIVTDSSIFLRHRETAQNGISTMQDQRKNNEIEKDRILTEKNNLQTTIQHEQNEISRITNAIQSTENELRDIEHRISRMERRARRKKRIGGFLMVVPVAGWIAGGTMRHDASRDLRRLRDQRHDTINFYRNMINVHRSQIDSKNGEIQNAENRISSLIANSRRLDEELASFSKLDQDLAKIQSDINSILPSVNKALSSIAKLKAVFDDIRQDLDGTLEAAKSAKENAEKKNLVYFIYNSISELQCKWDQASVKIVALDQCN